MGNPIFRFTLIHQTDEDGPRQFTNGDFSVSISGWSNYCFSGSESFTWTGATAKADASVSHNANTCYFGQQRIGGWDEGKYTIDITATNTSVTASATLPYVSLLSIYGSQDGLSFENITYDGSGSWTAAAGSATNRITFTTTKAYNYIYFRWNKSGPTSNYYVVLAIDTIEIISAPVRHQISEPDGWKDAKLVLERDKDFNDLVEHFEGKFIFYGNNGIDDGGIDFIKGVESNYGVDADIYIYIQGSFDDGASYEDIFTGLLDLPGSLETDLDKIDVPVLPVNTWIQFYNKKDTEVDLQATVDLNGNPLTQITPTTVTLTSQKVRRSKRSERELSFAFGAMTSAQGAQIGFDKVVLDEIEVFYDNFSSVETVSTFIPGPTLVPKEAGDYSFDFKVVFSRIQVTGSGTIPDPFVYSWENLQTWFQIFFQVNDETPSVFTRTDQSSGATKYSEFTYTIIRALQPGDRVRIYGDAIQTFSPGLPGNELVQVGTDPTGSEQNATGLTFPLSGLTSHLLITADTTFPANDAQGFLVHDAGAAIIQGIGLGNNFYSERLGSPSTIARTYVDEGCHWKNVVMQGLQIRGYTLTEKQFSMSFMDWWKGAAPLFNLGLGLTSSGLFQVEELEHFYDKDHVSAYFSNLRLTRSFDDDKIYNKITTGFNKWNSEDISGIDDPQTKHIYATRYRNSGQDLSILSSFICASNAWEFTRRSTIKESKDYKYDNDKFLVATNDGSGGYVPELDENFNTISGLLNSAFRYNIVHTPLRILLRHANRIGGCLQKYLASYYKFVLGEGNYDMVSDYDCTTGDECSAVICDSLDEGQNLPLGPPSNYNNVFGYLHLPDLCEVPIDMAWEDYKAIRTNKNYAVALSQTESNYTKFFIRKLSFSLCKSTSDFVGWAAEPYSIQVIESVQPPPDKFGWRPIDPVDPSGCNAIFYRAEFATTLNGWTNEGTDTIPVPSLQTLSGWTNTSTGAFPWTTGASPFVNTGGGLPNSEYLKGTFAGIGGVNYGFNYDLTIGASAFTPNVDVEFNLLDSGNNVLGSTVVTFITAGHKTGSIIVESPSEDAVYFAVRFINRGDYPTFTQSVTINSISCTTGATALPSWAWSSAFAGSAKAQILYNGYGVYNLVLNPAVLPSVGARVRIGFSVNNPDISLRFRVKDSGGSSIYETIFAEDITSAAEQSFDIDITNSSVLSIANKFEIIVESTDFDPRDLIYITDLAIIQCTNLQAGTFDADYQAIVDRGTALGYTLPSSLQQIKQNKLLLDLKTAGVWDNLDLLYVFATDGDRSFAKINWKSPTTFQCSEISSPTFTTNIGFIGDGTTAYLNTGWTPSINGVHFTLNNSSAFCYCNNDLVTAANVWAFGAQGNGSPGSTIGATALLPKSVSSNHVYSVNGGTSLSGSSVSSKGFFQIRRVASNDERVFKNGSQVGSTSTNASTILTTKEIYILAGDNNGAAFAFSLLEMGFFGLGSSLTGKESTFNTVWNGYFTSL